MSTRIRWLLLARIPLVCATLAASLPVGAAQAQPVPAQPPQAQRTRTQPALPAPLPAPSPFAPGDLKRPIFDTQTPVYDTTDKELKSASTVIAEVDGRAVTLGDLRDAIAELPPAVRNLPFADLFPTVREKLVRQQALVIRAQQQALDEDPAIRRKIKAASDQVLANALLEQEISRTITEDALLARYNKDIAGKPGPEEVHVRVIMLPAEQAAMDIIGELRGGADFAALAKRSSQDSTAAAGGDVGFVARDKLTPEVGAVVFSMLPGQYTPFPLRSAGSWFVLKVEERRREPTPPFSVVREDLRQAMLREGVPEVASAAMANVTVREFDFTGKETDASASDEGTRSVK
jgi:peptidyl-prolyl cis-trans isomerase C